VEYRTKLPKKDVERIVIYASSPTQAVVAEVDVLGIDGNSPENLWEKTSSVGGITKEDFDHYFAHHQTAYAYRLGKVFVYPKPKSLHSLGVKSVPQSFVYLP
jgi:predicted transcriptional regulator